VDEDLKEDSYQQEQKNFFLGEIFNGLEIFLEGVSWNDLL